MRRSQLACALLVSAAVLAPALAWSWGNVGHAVIARVAVDRLEEARPGSRSKLEAIYADNILHTEWIEDGQKKTCEARTLDELSRWADCVRYSPKQDPALFSKTRPYHFDDVPLGDKLDKDTPRTWCDEGCATEAIPKYLADLKTGQDPRKRAEALAFLIHFVGDLHQPLHGVDNHDSGGNSVKFPNPYTPKPGEKRGTMSFHSYWDGYLVGQAVGPQGPAVSRVAARADELAGGSGPLDDAALRVWLIESHGVAASAYERLGLDKKTGSQWLKYPPSASAKKVFKPQVTDRLALASLRLEAALAEGLN
jgi:hypothetical protein